MISPFSSLASSPRSGPLSPTMPIIESPGYNEPEYNDNDGNGENDNEYNDGNGEYNDGENDNEYNDGENDNEYNDGDNDNEYNDSDAQYDNASPNVAATSSLIVITAASRPRGIGAWLAHVERERRGSSILARLRSLVF